MSRLLNLIAEGDGTTTLLYPLPTRKDEALAVNGSDCSCHICGLPRWSLRLRWQEHDCESWRIPGCNHYREQLHCSDRLSIMQKKSITIGEA